MKYGVIVCPKCGMAKGVEADKKTTTCPCGREIVMSRMKIQFLTDSPIELAKMVADANAALRSGEQLLTEKKKKRKDPYAAISERAKVVKDPVTRLVVIARELTELRGDFSIVDLQKLASSLGKDSAEDILSRMREHNIVYESEEGRYRAV